MRKATEEEIARFNEEQKARDKKMKALADKAKQEDKAAMEKFPKGKTFYAKEPLEGDWNPTNLDAKRCKDKGQIG